MSNHIHGDNIPYDHIKLEKDLVDEIAIVKHSQTDQSADKISIVNDSASYNSSAVIKSNCNENYLDDNIVLYDHIKLEKDLVDLEDEIAIVKHSQTDQSDDKISIINDSDSYNSLAVIESNCNENYLDDKSAVVKNSQTDQLDVKFSVEVMSNSNNSSVVVGSECNESMLTDLNLVDYYKDWSNTYLSRIEILKSPMINSFDFKLVNPFKDYKTKFFTDKYCINFPALTHENFHNDILVRIHTNGVLLIALASGNTIMQSPKNIAEINFNINNNDRSNIVVKGKGKRGAKLIKNETTVCQVKLEGNSFYYNIRAGVEGLLVEFNETIKTNPNVIKTDPKGMGYVCMILPKCPKEKMSETVDNLDLLSEVEYLQYLANYRQK